MKSDVDLAQRGHAQKLGNALGAGVPLSEARGPALSGLATPSQVQEAVLAAHPRVCSEVSSWAEAQFGHDFIKPWEVHSVSSSESFAYPTCHRTSALLRKALRHLGVTAEELVCLEMPLASVSYQYRRGEDPFPPQHALLAASFPGPDGEERRLIIDPTWQQFLTHPFRRKEIRILRGHLENEGLNQPVLMFWESEAGGVSARVSRAMSRTDEDTCRMLESIRPGYSIEGLFSKIWDLSCYRKLEDLPPEVRISLAGHEEPEKS